MISWRLSWRLAAAIGRRLYYETMEQVLTRADKTIVQPGTQTYLPLPEVRRQQATPEAEAPAPTAQPTGAVR